ncbi:hypothetical protein LCX93_10935 [Sulfurimonas sp. SWIR-19]|uniref:hypothetical protein n=1 Tax=Sulfurimonas sp. SWIR-19 TaxID=2878390 RepID=UPI001CF56935|nr:hypothetical protein [Sulfurimonas sp. SWIR-19]UCN00029.1 hypothetical protein LCX93_10935 [Sulfurimonas sp. SWIR-19]
MNIFSYIGLPVAAGLLLVGCGGSGGDSTQPQSSVITGQFIDAAVTGLEYKCSSGTEGLTDALGYFTCKQGDNVAFSINGLSIGSAPAQAIITPITLAADNNTTATNIAQLLQTLDSDNNLSNGITIDSDSEEVKSLKGANISMDAIDFDSVAKSYIGKDLVDEASATAHMQLNVKNATNNKGVTSLSSVMIRTNARPEMCSSQTYTESTFEGYGSFEEFVNAGGSATTEYFNGDKSCSEYSAAGFCDAQELPAALNGNGSCVWIVTYPSTTTDTGATGGANNTDNTTATVGGISYEDYATTYKPLMPNLRPDNVYFNGSAYDSNSSMTTLYNNLNAPRMSDALYIIGAHPYSFYEVSEHTYTDNSLSRHSYGVDKNSSSRRNYDDTSSYAITQEGNIVKYTTTNGYTNEIHFSQTITDPDVLKQMYADVNVSIDFAQGDRGQFMLGKWTDSSGVFNSAFIGLLLNESAFQKVKDHYDVQMAAQ